MTLFAVVMLPIVIGLGAWQLDRAEYKRHNHELFVERTSALPTNPSADLSDSSDVAFLRVRLLGEFEPERYFLVDNQVSDSKPGYWVIASFRADDGRRWLVNRGWIAAPGQRNVLPVVPMPGGRVATLGAFWPNTGLVPLLAEDPWDEPWPIRVQRLDVVRMARLLENAAPFEVRLEAGQPGALQALPMAPGFDDRRHRGYAVQWFSLAVALVVGYVVFGFRR